MQVFFVDLSQKKEITEKYRIKETVSLK
jgi:hypothetical protein